MPTNLSSLGVKSILLDIEGTTTPLSFVYDVLFPYARKHLKDYLAKHFPSPDFQNIIQMLRKEHQTDVTKWAEPPYWDTQSPESERESIIKYLLWLMDKDRKSPALKRIQGKIWEGGYRRKELQGELFPDVPPALKRWNEAHVDLYIYSSGSVLAQKLLFAYTKNGDLSSSFRGFFDTRMGAKTAHESYRRISKEMKRSSQEILFISDQVKELDAAKVAGMKGLLCVRPFNSDQPENNYPSVETFDEILAETSPLSAQDSLHIG